MKWLCLVIAVRTLRSRNIFAARSAGRPSSGRWLSLFCLVRVFFVIRFFVVICRPLQIVIIFLVRCRKRSEPQCLFHRFFLFGREFLLWHLERSFYLDPRLVRWMVVLEPKADRRPVLVADERENLRFAQITDEHPAVLDRFFFLFCEFGIFELPSVEGLARYARLLTGRLDNRHSLKLV